MPRLSLKTCYLLSLLCVLLFLVTLSGSKQNFIFEMNQKKAQGDDSFALDVAFSFASYYNDHMVLQRGPKSSIIWGYSPGIGDGVVLTIGKQVHQTIVVDSGKPGIGIWIVKLDPVYDQGPFDIIATSSSGVDILLHDVLFGDVWLCSGQSNMQFTVTQGFNATEEINDAINYPEIRLFTVDRKVYSSLPLMDLAKGDIIQKWSVASPESVGGGKAWNYFSAVCWFYGKHLYQKLKYPIGLVNSCWGGTPVEAWSSPDALRKCHLDNRSPAQKAHHRKDSLVDDHIVKAPQLNSVLWNAMIHPLLNMTIYGAIWYQGEQNVNENIHLYNCTFPTMIDDWRQKFYEGTRKQTDPLFPFGFVMLAANGPDYTVSTGFPEIRWHQTADYGIVPNPRMKNTFMANAMDTPDFLSKYRPIHPQDKQDVAARLALGGLTVAYNQSLVFQGPTVTSLYMNSADQRLDIIYDNNNTEIDVRTYHGFEVCCSYTGENICKTGSSWWLPSTVLSSNKSSLTLTTRACPASKVTGIRYAWRTTPCSFMKCAVYAKKTQLPASPFLFYKNDFNKDGLHIVNYSSPISIP